MNFHLSTVAESDLTDICTCKSESGEERADELIERLVKQFMVLATFLSAGRSRPEIRKGLRSFAVEQYVVFYRIID